MKYNLSQITRREFARMSGLSVGSLLVQSSLSFSNDEESRDFGEWRRLSDMPTERGGLNAALRVNYFIFLK